MEIAEALKLRDSRNNPKGESLPDNQRVLELKLFVLFSAGVVLAILASDYSCFMFTHNL